MKPFHMASRLGVALAVVLLSVGSVNLLAAEETIKVDAILVWGTNEPKSPNPKHKPVDGAMLARLKKLPLKWTYYFEVNRKKMEVPSEVTRKEALSKECQITVHNSGKSKVEVALFGKGEQVVKQSQDFPVGETIVLGGNAPNETAWLVVLKRNE